MFLQIMPTDNIQEASASSTLFLSFVVGVFVLGAIAFLLVSRRVKK